MPKAPPEGSRDRPFVLSIPAGVPFLECLADGLLDGGVAGRGYPALRGDPLALSDVRIFLPTRRAARALQEIFAAKLGGAALLPAISALGDFDEDDDAFDDDVEPGLPKAIGETERRLVLANFIQGWAKIVARAIRSDAGEADLISTSPGEAMSLAIALGQLIDSFETEQVPWEKLAKLVPPEHDKIWQLTTSFLNVAAEQWPQYLRDNDVIGDAALRNLRLRALAQHLEETQPTAPVIVAGSTGSNPATADLMEIVSTLPNGAVVLQGLDTRADPDTWREIGGEQESGPVPPQAWTHPQHFFFRLLKRLDVQLGEVGLVGREDHARDRRRALVSQALLPSTLTDRWSALSMDTRSALDGVTLIEAANEREEALAIALVLREALEAAGTTAALVTPDRNLARRVAAELRRWGIETEDSAGLPLADSSAGILARLVAEAAVHDLAPAALLPLLRHPSARFGLDGAALQKAADVLELGVLRGPSPPPGADGLLNAIANARRPAEDDEDRHWHPAKRGLTATDWEVARTLAEKLKAALEPLCAFGRGGHQATLHDFLAPHRAALVAVRAGADADPDQDSLDKLFGDALSDASKAIAVRLADYPAIFKTLLRNKAARAKRPGHPRLRILGALEARLLGFDRVVLGGLNEGTWPAQAENDPFLSRPMRGALGLPPPEWRVGLSAHDFEQALGGKDIVLTRAKKSGGAPSVAARWLQRLAAVAGAASWNTTIARGAVYLALAEEMDRADAKRLGAPLPAPPRELRPKRLSVTEIETLIRDPYAIYAKHVLKLRPLDPIGMEPGASDRGTLIHGVLAEFIASGADVFSDDAEDRLVALGKTAFAPIWDYPDVRALWWPRFRRVAQWFVGWERDRRATVSRTYTESAGKLDWQTVGERMFTLSGRADRFDALTDGAYSVVDYKTGALPGHGEVLCGLAPQLPLEAAMLAGGGFGEPAAGLAHDFTYVRLTGQAVAGEVREIDLKGKSAAEIADEALAELKTMIDRFEDPAQPYRPGTHPKFRRRPNGDYDHLARIAEWGLSPEADEGGE